MLCTRGKDLQIEFRDVVVEGERGRAHWDARYTFSATGRKVLNRIDAQFELRDGLIVRHVDQFDFALWARQALGLPGLLLGWTGWFQAKVKAQVVDNLAKFKP
jgi:hypothetical protein